MGQASKLSEIREQAKACHRALVELETRAGIAEAAERLRTEPASYLGIYDAAEYSSDKWQELVEAEETDHQEHNSRRLRDLYFNVRDFNLRKDLIAKDREEGSLALRYWQQELGDAAAELKAARSVRKHWWVWASILGIALVGLGFHLFGLVGALAGLLVGYFNGRRMESDAFRARTAAMADAGEKIKEAEQIWNKVRNQPQRFSKLEATTGEPDPDNRLLGI